MELELESYLRARPRGAVDQPAMLVAHQGEAARQHALIAEAREQTGRRAQPFAGIAQVAPDRMLLARRQALDQPLVARQPLAELIQPQPPAQPAELTRALAQQ